MKKLDFKKLTKQTKNDPDVLALIIQGSRGKGFHKPDSDHDVLLVVKDKAKKSCEKNYYKNWDNIDLGITSLSELKKSIKMGRDDDWDRYDYAHVKYIFCKSKRVKELVKKKGYLPKADQKSWINSSLDAYTNAFFRSVKAKKKGYDLGSHIEATASIPPLLNALFGLELRHAPFYGYLEKELEVYPLKNLPIPKLKLLEDIKMILKGDIKTQQKLFGSVKKFFIQHGYKKVFDDWEGRDEKIASLTM